MVLHLRVDGEHDQRHDARREGLGEGEQHHGDAGQCAADHRQEVDERDPERPQEWERHAEHNQRDEHNEARDDRCREVAEHVAGDRTVHRCRDAPVSPRALLGHQAEEARSQLRALHQQQHDEDEDGQQGDHERDSTPADAEDRLGDVLSVGGQLGRVGFDPILDVVPGDEVADPAFAVLGLADIARQAVGQMGHSVDERVAEGHGQSGEYQDRQERDDRDGDSAPAYPAL